MKKIIFFFFAILATHFCQAQSFCSCNKTIKHWSKCYEQNPTVAIRICCRAENSLGMQGFSAAVENKTADKLDIEFDFQVELNCGKVVTRHAHLYEVKPYEKVSGERFSGDLDLAHDFFYDECKAKPIIKQYGISIINLKIENLSQKEKKKEIDERKKEEEMLAKQKEEDTKQEELKKEEDARVARLAHDKEVANEAARKKTEAKKIEDEKIAAAERKRIQDSINNENSRKRVEAVRQTDNAEDNAMGAMAGGVIAAASLMKDQYTDKFAYLKYYLGLGWDNIPIVANNDDARSSSSEATSHPVAQAGLRVGLFNNKGISLHLSPFISYGMNALSPGNTGTHLSYGGFGTLLLSPKAKSRLKIFGEAGYIARSGDWYYDLDAALAGSDIVTGVYTNLIQTSTYNYKVARYGGGIMLHWTDDEETYIRPGFYYEQPYPVQKTDKPVWVANVQALISSFLLIDVSYSNNYFSHGDLKYPANFQKENTSFFSIKLIKSGRIF